jgi:uncharacterized protein
MTFAALAALAAVATLALVVECALGFGGTLIATCVGAQLAPLKVIVPAFVPLDLAMSTWLVARGSRQVDWRWLTREVAPPAALGIAPGLLLSGVSSTWLPTALGALVALLAARELARRTAATPTRLTSGALLGLGGLAHGLFATGGPFVVYVARNRVPDPQAFRATLAVLWIALDATAIAWFVATGRYDAATIRLLLVFAIAFVPALAVGERLHRSLHGARFTRAAWVLLLVAGCALAIRGACA